MLVVSLLGCFCNLAKSELGTTAQYPTGAVDIEREDFRESNIIDGMAKFGVGDHTRLISFNGDSWLLPPSRQAAGNCPES